jgi:outer membrane receptor protein involved in Fe transport
MPLASALMVAIPGAFAQQATETAGLEEIIVTAQKRTEDLQAVPLSIAAFDTQKLEELKVQDFEDYVKYLPNVSYQQLGPGFARIFMRGVSSGDNGNHSGPLPSVGMYLDEQPITTIQGPLDIHIYDVARVETLAGPQGTLSRCRLYRQCGGLADLPRYGGALARQCHLQQRGLPRR